MYFKNKNLLSKVLLSFLFLFLITPTNIFAQTIAPEDKNPLSMEINTVAYSNEKRVVTLNFSVTNNSDSFYDNLEYALEFYNGEKLADRGYLFRDLQYVVASVGDFERLAPGKTITKTVQYKMPEAVPGGKYFIRGGIYNEEISVFGITYTKEPLNITGRGGFVLNKIANLVDVKTGTEYQALEGPVLEKDGEYVLAYLKDKNESLFNALDNGEIYADVKINHLSDKNEVVYEKQNIPLSTLVNEDGSAVEFEIEGWENKRSGSHSMEVSFKSPSGDQISETTFARLLYRGLFGRIFKAETRINSYRKGDLVSLRAEVSIAGDESAKKANLKAVYRFEGEIVQEFQKEIELNGLFSGTNVTLTLMDQAMDSKSLVDSVDLFLTSEDGTVLDYQTITIDTSEIFAYPKETGWLKNILISLVLLIGGAAILLYIKKKTNLTIVSILITALLISGSVIAPNLNSVFAQDDDSNDYCYDMNAINYGAYGQCEYIGDPYCQDITASNFGANGVCEYDDPIYGCIDFTATNYNDSATIDDGTCSYDMFGCTDPAAINFDLGASIEDWSCKYSGCTDEWASNYNPGATEDDGSCEYRSTSVAGKGELIQITFDGIEFVDTDICQETTVPTVYYVHLTCMVCGNVGGEIFIEYFNKGVDNYSIYNDSFTVNTNEVGGGHEFVNFVFGPYLVDFVLENKNPDGSVDKSLYKDGKYVQNFAVQATTQFGSEFCRMTNESGELYTGKFTETEVREVVINSCSEIRASFYLDDDNSGTKGDDEVYLKSPDARGSCNGQVGAPFGFIKNIFTNVAFTELESNNCDIDDVPYFFKDLLDAGDYEVGIDIDNSFGLIQTGIEYFINSDWVKDPFISVSEGERFKSRIGVKVEHPGGVAISCEADPRYTEEAAASVTWSIVEPPIGDKYSMDQLEFIWQGAGEDDNKDKIYSKTYPKSTDTETHSMSVYAVRKSDGVQVSNTAYCRMIVSPFIATCTTSDINNNPKIDFDVGEDVIWKVTTVNGNAPFEYTWTGIGDAGNNSNLTTSFYNKGDRIRGSVTVTDNNGNGKSAVALCPYIFIRECNPFDDPCSEGYDCNGIGMCVLPPPIYEKNLTLDPSVVRSGEACGLSWIVDGATSCVLKRNNTIVPDLEISTSTPGSLLVEPGTYTMECFNDDGLMAQGGPVRCLVNPDIREQ